MVTEGNVGAFKSKELRIALTSKCNYRCFFCHNEGFDKEYESFQKRTEFKFKETLSVVGKLLNEGYTDITLTGGEPLLKKDNLYEIIDFIKANSKDLPYITIVTNGYFIDEEFANKIKTYEKLKVNISLHSFDKAVYQSITRTKNSNLDDIIKNIKILVDKKIATKINYVLLKGINNSKEQIKEAIEKSRELGVYAIKFIELLVTDANEQVLPYYYEVKSISNIYLKDKLSCIKDDGRKAEYRFINESTDFRVETAKCSCKNGCSQCLRYKPLVVDSFSNLRACFVDRDELSINVNNYKSVIEDAGKRIIKMAKLYGNKAPILNNEPTFQNERSEVYFEFEDSKYTEFLRMYKEQNIMRTRYYEQSYFIYMPRTADSKWKNYEITLRVREDRNSGEAALNMSYIEVQKQEVEGIGFLINRTRFAKSDRFLQVGNGEEIKELIKTLDFEEKFNYELKGFYYRNRDSNGLKFSIAEINFNNHIKKHVVCFFPENNMFSGIREFVARYNLKPINKIFFKWAEDMTKLDPKMQ